MKLCARGVVPNTLEKVPGTPIQEAKNTPKNTKEETSCLYCGEWRHVCESHGDDDTPPEFTMKVNNVRRNDATLRQITEGVQINRTPPQMLLNNKQEWHAGGGIVATSLTRM